MIQEHLLNHTQALYPTIIFIENQHTYVKQRSKMIMRTNEGLHSPPHPPYLISMNENVQPSLLTGIFFSVFG